MNRTLISGAVKYYADIFRGAYYYYYKNIDGLRRPPQNKWYRPKMKITAYKTDEGNSFNIHYVRGLDEFGFLQPFKGLFYYLDNFISTIHMKTFGRDSTSTIGTTIHELAHSSHAYHAGVVNFVGAIIDSNAAMTETYAQTIEWYLTTKLYKEVHNYEFSFTGFPNFLGYQRGIQNRYIGRPESDDAVYTAFMVDLIDDYNQREERIDNRLPFDRVTGYSIQQIEREVFKNKTFLQLANDLANNYENDTEEYIHELRRQWEK